MCRDSYSCPIVGGALAMGLVLVAQNLLKPGTWHEPFFLAVAMAFIWLWSLPAIPPHIKAVQKRFKESPIFFPWAILFLISIFGLAFGLVNIPFFAPQGVWSEMMLLVFFYRIYHIGMDYVMVWYAKRSDEFRDQSNP